MKRLSINLPRNALVTIYESFIRPHLDYGDILMIIQTMKTFKAN